MPALQRIREYSIGHENPKSLDFIGLRQLEISSQGAQLLPVGSAVFCSAKKRLTATRQVGLFAKVDELLMVWRAECLESAKRRITHAHMYKIVFNRAS